jgi:hypothetical protein
MGVLEAAIGIEPMNKGFAVLKGLFSQVMVNADECGSIGLADFFSVRLFGQILSCFAW